MRLEQLSSQEPVLHVEKKEDITPTPELEKQIDAISTAIEAIRSEITGKITVDQDVRIRSLLADMDELCEQLKRRESPPANS